MSKTSIFSVPAAGLAAVALAAWTAPGGSGPTPDLLLPPPDHAEIQGELARQHQDLMEMVGSAEPGYDTGNDFLGYQAHFYTTDRPFDEVVAHYARALEEAGQMIMVSEVEEEEDVMAGPPPDELERQFREFMETPPPDAFFRRYRKAYPGLQGVTHRVATLAVSSQYTTEDDRWVDVDIEISSPWQDPATLGAREGTAIVYDVWHFGEGGER